MPHRGNTFLTLLQIWCPLPSPTTREAFPSHLGSDTLFKATLHMGILLTVLGLWYLTLVPQGCSSNPPGHLPCSTSPKELHWSGRKGEVTKGEEEELCTWFCCLYCTNVCGFATLVSLRVFIKWFKEFRNDITTTILRIILNGFIFFFYLLKKSIFRSRLGKGKWEILVGWMNGWMDAWTHWQTELTDR